MKLHVIKYFFSLKQISTQRVKFQHKICFKKSLLYLRLKTTPSIAIVSRLFRDGNFLRLYKKLQQAFLYNLIPRVSTLPQNNEFKNLFKQYHSFRDLNRVLFWKLTSVNCLFNLKKMGSKKNLYFLNPNKRVVLPLLWIKNVIKLKKFDYSNCSTRLFLPLLKFIAINKSNCEIFNLKLKIYKTRLLRG